MLCFGRLVIGPWVLRDNALPRASQSKRVLSRLQTQAIKSHRYWFARKAYERSLSTSSNLGKCHLKSYLFISVVCHREDNDKKYTVGETFTTKNCSQSCRCNENGEISCVPLCSKIKCPKGKRSKGLGVINVGEKNGCSCEIQECVPGMLCNYVTFIT